MKRTTYTHSSVSQNKTELCNLNILKYVMGLVFRENFEIYLVVLNQILHSGVIGVSLESRTSFRMSFFKMSLVFDVICRNWANNKGIRPTL